MTRTKNRAPGEPRNLPREREFRRTARRIERALLVLNGLYFEDRYVPVIRKPAEPLLLGAFDIVCAPVLGDRVPLLLARVCPHLYPTARGELHAAFGMARAVLREHFPLELERGNLEPPAIVWVFGYIPPVREYWGDGYRPAGADRDDPSILVGWRFNWSAGTFRNRAGSNYWVGEVPTRMRIPDRWSRNPRRWIRDFKSKRKKGRRD